MTSQDIHKLKLLLRRLEVEDKSLRVFGASQHKYQLNATLSEGQLVAFERRHGITLPQDYRDFLKNVGNGGAGPGYGLYPLNKTVVDTRPEIPFALNALSHLSNGWLSIPLIDDTFVPGILEIETQGCAHATYLVVNGDTYGTLWNCWSVDEVHPAGLTFSVWYQQWMSQIENVLQILAMEKEAEAIKEGMTTQDAINILGSQWHIQKPSGTNRCILKFDGLATKFELIEVDRIGKRLEFNILY